MVVRIRDEGIGIDPELLPRVFDLFTQAETSRDQNESGLGIGLALVKNIVEMHQGTVEVHSGGIGQGSEIIVCLPTASKPEAEEQTEAGPPDSTRDMSASDSPVSRRAPLGPQSEWSEVSGTLPGQGVRALRILVVDDSVDAAKMSSMLLCSWGHEVRVAHNGSEALQTVGTFQPHVILLDIGDPTWMATKWPGTSGRILE